MIAIVEILIYKERKIMQVNKVKDKYNIYH